jgi:hypothetical protein
MEGDKGRWFAHGSTGRDDPGHSETTDHSQFLIISALGTFPCSYGKVVVACYWLVETQGYLSGIRGCHCGWVTSHHQVYQGRVYWVMTQHNVLSYPRHGVVSVPEFIFI